MELLYLYISIDFSLVVLKFLQNMVNKKLLICVSTKTLFDPTSL
jgi:hypothetical protein